MGNKYRLHGFARKIGVSVKTLSRCYTKDKLIAKRALSNQRFYEESDLQRLYGIQEEPRKTVVYCRLSSARQKEDLKSQVAAMEQFCLASGIAVDEWIQEIGSGMNFKRKKFLSLTRNARRLNGNHSYLFLSFIWIKKV